MQDDGVVQDGPSGEEPAAEDDRTDASAPVLVPTVEPAPQAEPTAVETVDWTRTASVDGDYYVLGNPAAPLRLIDYSDFM